jgi:hypothetical protein
LKVVKNNDQVSTSFNPCKSKALRQRRHTVNRMSTSKAPSHTLNERVSTPWKPPLKSPQSARKRYFRG